jgi:hypothetical protein
VIDPFLNICRKRIYARLGVGKQALHGSR